MKRKSAFAAGLLVTAVFATGCSASSDGTSSAQGSGIEVGQATNELTSNGLTKKQTNIVLELIDNICGDTWCEGDHNFHFDQLQCARSCDKTPGNCRLAFRIFPYDSDLDTGPSYARSCTTPNFTGFASLVETAQSGYQSLNWDFYDALSACISKLESELPPT